MASQDPEGMIRPGLDKESDHHHNNEEDHFPLCSPPPQPRPQPRTAATVIPAVLTTTDPFAQHDRSDTVPVRLRHRHPGSIIYRPGWAGSPTLSNHRRAESTNSSLTSSQPTPLSALPFPLPKSAKYAPAPPPTFWQPAPASDLPRTSPSEIRIPRPATPRSKPIPIPPRPKPPGIIGTPLTARPQSPHPLAAYVAREFARREEAKRNHEPVSSSDSSLEYLYNPNGRPKRDDSFTMSPKSHHQPSFRPSSPLAAPIPIPANENQHKARPRSAAPNLNLAGLPKYHPANFPNSDSNTPLSPRSVRAMNSQAYPSRLGSDAQQKLHKYQRDVVASATRRSGITTGMKNLAKPTSPRLIPLGSPAEIVTPLMLEGQSDYLMAGSHMSPSAFKDEDEARRAVEEMVQKENERRDHPEARSGSLSPAVSPAVSPRV